MQHRARGGRSASLQAKLSVGPAGDRYEREADSVARQVVAQIAAGHTAAPPAPSGAVARQAIDDEELLQGKLISRAVSAAGEPIGLGGGEVDAATASSIERARGGGAALDAPVRRSMEGAFGVDFSSVRLHQGSSVNRMNESLGARAFTTGSDVFMSAGEFQPASRTGQELLAHELTHVVQQGGATPMSAN